jgi:hypothetical protein
LHRKYTDHKGNKKLGDMLGKGGLCGENSKYKGPVTRASLELTYSKENTGTKFLNFSPPRFFSAFQSPI